MEQLLFYPEAASTMAGKVDAVFFVLTITTIIFTLLICLAIIYFAVKYRRGARVDRSNPPHENLPVELGWTILPTIILIGLFLWATSVYFTTIRTPKNTMEIYVVAKQWMWKLQHPQGRWEMNQLHVPVGRPIKLTMTSEDVIHSFFVPVFRVKADVLPGRYTTIWFTPTKPGKYHLFCGEFCGTNHSGMVGSVFVMEPADYEKWLRVGNINRTMASRGEQLFRKFGCGGCHGPGSSVRAPLLEGIYGKPVPIELPGGATKVIVADDRYIHDSIVLPEQEIAAGYKPIMPTFKGRIKEEELLQILDYIKSLGTASVGESSTGGSSIAGGSTSAGGASDRNIVREGTAGGGSSFEEGTAATRNRTSGGNVPSVTAHSKVGR